MPNPFGLPFDDPATDPQPAADRGAPETTARAPEPTPPLSRQRTTLPPNRPATATAPDHSGDASVGVAPRPPARRPLTVTQLTTAIRDHLESEFHTVWVEGELSNCKVWNTGHLYFTLKDDRSQVRGFMFRTSLRYLKFKPVDGLHVVARGKVSVYEPKGEYQLTCEHLEPKGLGALQLAYEQLKKRLQAEGLFDPARKRPLPALPRRIGIVTSLDGAAVRDMLKVLGRRHHNAQVVIRPARVQGDGAAAEIARGIHAVGRLSGVDVVIVGRGGGSIEDLWAFNEESVARAIAACPVPVISAVGHETDVTIADFVADRRAPTPSAAAEIVVSAKDEFCSRIDRLRGRLDAAALGRVQALSRRVHMLSGRPAFAGVPTRIALRSREVSELGYQLARQMRERLTARSRRVAHVWRQLESFDLGRRLGSIRTRLATSDARLRAGIVRREHQAETRLRESAGRLASLSPLAVLGRGYAVAWDGSRSRVLRDAADVRPGDRVTVTLARGELDCDVRETR
jgi:exodeoxyribonuclease VII large subunit